jgi:hypothetical protein
MKLDLGKDEHMDERSKLFESSYGDFRITGLMAA